MSLMSLPKVVIILMIIQKSVQKQCLDESGSPVDWFIVYKVPKLETSPLKTLRSGFGYSFITNKSVKTSKDWTLSEKQVNQKDSIFGQTIGSVIDDLRQSSDDVSYVVYNDQKPNSKSSSSSAHSKGLFVFDSDGAFWLTHSVPRFPSLSKEYDFPDNAKHNGQTAICVTLDSKDAKSIGSIAYQLMVMRPNIYGIKIEDDLSHLSNLWIDLKNKKYLKNETQSQLQLKSKQGVIFTSFAKSGKYLKDIYSGLIATYFKEDLLVQSWRNGAGGKLDSDCEDRYKVQNIDKIQIPNVNTVDWNSTEDHSKWLITSTGGTTHTCIADINRMRSQFKRGGGSVCIDSSQVWNIFKKSVESVEGCHVKSGHKKKPKEKSKSSG